MLAFIVIGRAVHKLYLAAKMQLYNDRFIQINFFIFFLALYAANTKLCTKGDVYFEKAQLHT